MAKDPFFSLNAGERYTAWTRALSGSIIPLELYPMIFNELVYQAWPSDVLKLRLVNRYFNYEILKAHFTHFQYTTIRNDNQLPLVQAYMQLAWDQPKYKNSELSMVRRTLTWISEHPTWLNSNREFLSSAPESVYFKDLSMYVPGICKALQVGRGWGDEWTAQNILLSLNSKDPKAEEPIDPGDPRPALVAAIGSNIDAMVRHLLRVALDAPSSGHSPPEHEDGSEDDSEDGSEDGSDFLDSLDQQSRQSQLSSRYKFIRESSSLHPSLPDPARLAAAVGSFALESLMSRCGCQLIEGPDVVEHPMCEVAARFNCPSTVMSILNLHPTISQFALLDYAIMAVNHDNDELVEDIVNFARFESEADDTDSNYLVDDVVDRACVTGRKMVVLWAVDNWAENFFREDALEEDFERFPTIVAANHTSLTQALLHHHRIFPRYVENVDGLWRCLVLAAQTGAIGTSKLLLDSVPSILKSCLNNYNMDSIFVESILNHQRFFAKFLIEYGHYDVSRLNFELSRQALNNACIVGDLAMTQWLIEDLGFRPCGDATQLNPYDYYWYDEGEVFWARKEDLWKICGYGDDFDAFENIHDFVEEFRVKHYNPMLAALVGGQLHIIKYLVQLGCPIIHPRETDLGHLFNDDESHQRLIDTLYKSAPGPSKEPPGSAFAPFKSTSTGRKELLDDRLIPKTLHRGRTPSLPLIKNWKFKIIKSIREQDGRIEPIWAYTSSARE